LAGQTAINNRIAATIAARRVCFFINPSATINSAAPLKATRAPG
jgi:hypothetical protein